MSIQEFKSRVDGIMNVVFAGGLANHTAIIELMIYIIFLRELHTHDREQALLDDDYDPVFSGELATYRWDNILSLNSEALFSHLGDAFEKLYDKSPNQTIKMLYNKAHIKLFDKPALRTVVHKIEELMKEIETEEKADRSDLFGDLYEYLLSSLSSAGTGGQFRTPRHIIKFMVSVIDPSAEESICDPACGTAGFLVAALEHLKEKYTSEDFKKEGKYPMNELTEKQQKFLYNQSFTGFDSDPDMIKFGLMNLYFHKLENATVRRRNTLVDTQGETTKWDIILANPPFAGVIDRDAVAEELQIETGATEVLFLNYMIRHLSDRGRCAVIVPEGVIFKTATANKKIREKLVDDAGLWAVVSLPSGVFNPYAGVKTSILFFDKTKKETNNEIVFVKIENDGFDLGAQRRPIDRNDLPVATEILQAWRKGEKIESPLVLFVKKSKIAEDGDYNLSGDRYLVATDYSKAKWPMVKLGEVCSFEYGKPLKKEDRKKGEYPVFGSNGIVGYHDEYLTEGPFIIVGRKGTAGAVVYSEKSGFPIDTAFYVNLLDKNKVSLRFLFYILQTSKLDKMNTQAGVPGLNRNDAYKLKIPLPPLKIQERIVAEIEVKQNAIKAAQEVIKNLEREREYFDQSLRKLKGIEWVEFDSVIKTITPPKKIQKVNFGKIGKYPIIDQSQNEIAGWTDDESALVKNDKSMVIFGDHTCVIKYSDIPFAQGADGIKILSVNDKLLPKFLYFFLITGIVESGEYARHFSKLKEIRIPLPSLEIQERLVVEAEKEQRIIEANKDLIEIMEFKIMKVLDDIIG